MVYVNQHYLACLAATDPVENLVKTEEQKYMCAEHTQILQALLHTASEKWANRGIRDLQAKALNREGYAQTFRYRAHICQVLLHTHILLW